MKTESFQLRSEIKIRILVCCTVCEFCVDACPDVFGVCNGRVIVLVESIPPEMNDLIQEIVEECPVKAIVKG